MVSLRLKDSETFEAFSRRLDLLIQRLLNWRPPVVLPEQLLLFCALRAFSVHPYGPVRHIILASPDVRFQSGMDMLRGVAGTGAQVIRDTLGSGETGSKSNAVLCANPCPVPPASSSSPRASSRARRTPAGRGRRVRKPRGPSKLCQSEGPCKHHGPHSFHATSECRDPTLSRSKRTQPRDDTSARALTAAVRPTSSSSPAEEDPCILRCFLLKSRLRQTAVFHPAARVLTPVPRAGHIFLVTSAPQIGSLTMFPPSLCTVWMSVSARIRVRCVVCLFLLVRLSPPVVTFAAASRTVPIVPVGAARVETNLVTIPVVVTSFSFPDVSSFGQHEQRAQSVRALRKPNLRQQTNVSRTSSGYAVS